MEKSIISEEMPYEYIENIYINGFEFNIRFKSGRGFKATAPNQKKAEQVNHPFLKEEACN